MKITLPGKVTEIIENLQMHGYEAYAVGGCVRFNSCKRTSGLGYHYVCKAGRNKKHFFREQ